MNKTWNRLIVVASALLAVACGDGDSKPTASDASALGDSAKSDGISDGYGGDAGYVALPGVPTDVHVDVLPPGQVKMTQEQRKNAIDKLKSGAEFVDIHMRSDVVMVPAATAAAVTVAPDRLTLPVAGHEAMLSYKAGTPLVGGRGDSSGNPFGFLRKVKEIKQVGEQIVITTERARLQDIFVGAMSMKIDPEQLQVLDTDGVDEGQYFLNRDGTGQGQRRRQPGQRWGRWRAPLTDPSFSVNYVGDWSASASFTAFSVDTSKSFGNVSIGLSGEGSGTANMSFKPSFYLKMGVDWFDFEYLSIGAGGQLDLSASVDATIKMSMSVALGSQAGGDAKKGLDSAPVQPSKTEIDLFELGPFAGPPIPTTPVPIPTAFKVRFVGDCSETIHGDLGLHLEGGVSTGAGFGTTWEEPDSCSSDSDCWTTCNNGTCGNGWQSSSATNWSTWHNSTYTLSGGVEVECGITPKIEWLLADIAGPEVNVRGAVKGAAEYESTCPDSISTTQPPDGTAKVSVSVGVGVAVGGTIDLVITSLDYAVTLYEKWWQLWSYSKAYPQGGIGLCISTCSNGYQDSSETDSDCGGICPTKCAQDYKCKVNTDCASGNCLYKNGAYHCGPSLCADKLQDGSETDVDCGGLCATKCPLGKKCAVNSDCAAAYGCVSKFGDPNFQTCQVPTCADGWQGPAETAGVDCGGSCSCQAKVGCTSDADCPSGKACAKGGCVNSADKQCYLALDGKQGAGETHADCGGPCAGKISDPNICDSTGVCGSKLFLCADGISCAVGSDCASGFCSASGVCAQHCGDGSKDGNESDVDCGGSCAPCGQSQGCSQASDCGSGLMCSTATATCIPATCASGKKDGDETDVDCGGSCPVKCGNAKGCKSKYDCQSSICSTSLKCVGSTCENGVLDYAEGSVDCGGICPACANGKACNPMKNWSCASGYCNPKTLVCATPDCNDGIQNGSESDADCGGSCATMANSDKFYLCAKGLGSAYWSHYSCHCSKGRMCKTSADCSVGLVCAAGKSGYNPTCQPKCPDGTVSGNETDVDCGGPASECATRCALGKACWVNSDCDSGACIAGVCAPPTCPNGVQDGSESDVDCGPALVLCNYGYKCQGSGCVKQCPSCDVRCGLGKKCSSDDACASGLCSAAGVCVSDHCQDGKKDAGETDIDCGGTCGACAVGKACGGDSDCDSGNCLKISYVCGPSCSDGVQNGDESDVDCGGSCKQCQTNQHCISDKDCPTYGCSSKGFCSADPCHDATKNGLETGIDCAGKCTMRCLDSQGCKGNEDCASGVCKAYTTGSFCVGSGSCGDKLQNNSETDIDCGGGSCAACADTKKCKADTDCKNSKCGNCTTTKGVTTCTCQAVSCSDGKPNGSETDVDCGGTCASKCAVAKKCKVAGDCASAACNPTTGLCTDDHCSDGVANGGETGVDCGATCPAKCKAGTPCTAADQCADGFCAPTALFSSKKQCATVCNNFQLDPGEGDVDCGGSCPKKCAATASCAVASDCASGLCNAITKMCAATACDDGTYDPAKETDLDCGGTCASVHKCGPSQKCSANADCFNGTCSGGLCQDTCGDGVANFAETDIDCGGFCKPCAVGKICSSSADCTTGACTAKKCAVPSTCNDGLVSGNETDVDCGGFCAVKCSAGKKCASGTDCIKGFCSAVSKTCVSDTCFDQAPSPGESDSDCGGVCAQKCANGLKCGQSSDCQSGICSPAGKCAASTCENGQKDADEVDVDCGGACKVACGDGKACGKPSDCQSGICSVGGVCVTSTCEDGNLNGDESDTDCGGSCKTACGLDKQCSKGADCASGVCSIGHLCVASACEDGTKSGGETGVDCGGGCATGCKNGEGCGGPDDCLSGICSASNLCVASTCQDGVVSGGESDVDCGGPCQQKCGVLAKCSAASDCQSAACSVSGTCVASACQDGALSGNETDVDCGGSCSGACAVGKGCKVGSDCQSALCSTAGKCVASACQDGKMDAGETGVDCGGPCSQKCALNSGCTAGSDCASGVCSVASHLCVDSTCKDEAKDGDESDIDCGGSCGQKCLGGKGCVVSGDCVSSQCGVGGSCVASACENGVKDAGESDVDCGGACPGCATGKACSAGSDCVTSVCSAGKQCVASTCQDGSKTPGESDIDCGGTCAQKCADGKTCSGSQDCVSSVCASKSLVCVSSTCQDQKLSGDETGVDCGGSCSSKCALGLACKVGSDCATGVCNAQNLCAADLCSDAVKNGGETDVDCGGSCSQKCANAKTCGAGSDCQSGVCSVGGKCVASTCVDGAKDGSETGVDCGGSCATKCSLGVSCSVGSDCSSGVCSAVGKQCVANTCLDQTKNNSETGVDCGGSCSTKCGLSQGCSSAADCQSGICSATSKLCVASTCQDQLLDGGESDVDCGAVCSTKCANSKKCTAGGDCASSVCSASKLCVASTCQDGYHDGNESDIDCGGSCSKCAAGKVCVAGSDCSSTFCAASSHVCVATSCTDQLKDGNETDVDCGGSCSPCAGYAACTANTDCASGVCSPAGKCSSSCVDATFYGLTATPAPWKLYSGAYYNKATGFVLTNNADNQVGYAYDTVDYLKPGVDTTLSFMYRTGDPAGSWAGAGMALNIVAAASVAELETYIAAAKGASCLGYGAAGPCGTTTVKSLHIELDERYDSSSAGAPFTDPTNSTHVAIALNGDPSKPVAWVNNGAMSDYKYHTMTVAISGNTVTVSIDGTKILSKAIAGWTFQGGFVGFSAATGLGITNWHWLATAKFSQGTCP